MDIYITEDSELIFTIAANNSHENNISTGVQRCCGHSGHSSHSISADPGIVPQAHDMGFHLANTMPICSLCNMMIQ